MKHIAILVCDSAWAGSISLILEIFKTAQVFQARQQLVPDFKVSLLGLHTEEINTFAEITITPELSVGQCDIQFDAILIPAIWGIDNHYLTQHQLVYPWLQRHHQQGALIIGLLTGSYLMAEAGLLNQRIATTHWHYAEDFRRRYPQVRLQAEQMQTSEDGLFCGGSVNAGMDLSLHLIQLFCGNSVAQQCERHCLMGTRRDYHKLTVDMADTTTHDDERILAIQEWLQTHYAEPLALQEIAARFGFSPRNLTRRFKAATGKTVQTYIRHYRIEIAKERLIKSSHTIQHICFNTGYESLTVFGRCFKAYTGMSPSEFRLMNTNAVSY